MKRFSALFLLPAFMILTGASIWEGAASVSAGGELPDEGYYAATNSFPRNTVVDVTNLETGKTIRVIVAASLDTPGLLAVLSRDAALSIGLRASSIGRIRLEQPQDPIAFSLFTEGLASSGDPDFDPRARIAAEYGGGGAVPDKAVSETPPPEAVFVDVPPPESAAETDPAETDGSKITEAPDPPPVFPPVAEFTESKAAGEEIVDIPDYYSPPASETNAPEPDLAWVVPDAEEGADVSPAPEPPAETPAAPPAVAAVPEAATTRELSLVPSGERPPEDWYTVPPAEVIPPVSGTSELPAQSYTDPVPVQPAAAGIFSVPVINSLEHGKYYLQLGAYSKAEAVEPEISRIGKSYPIVVQNGGSMDNPVYRILLGPVNLGESGALLERFKSSGYSDAFVRGD
ncbi:MAG: SPOR domain-containing protein [Treponema sp.]|jgi:hypothetical protein|nr:SPOR domain-containing protein [Treponema sp.]